MGGPNGGGRFIKFIRCSTYHHTSPSTASGIGGVYLNIKLGDASECVCDIGEDGAGEWRVLVGQSWGQRGWGWWGRFSTETRSHHLTFRQAIPVTDLATGLGEGAVSSAVQSLSL